MSMVQLGLHSKCCNRCDFCLLKENGINTIDKILEEIEHAKENIKYISTREDNWLTKFSDGISLLGGEIFFIQDESYKKAILELIDVILEYVLIPNKKNKKCRFSTVTNGMYDPNWLLFPVVDKIASVVGIDHVDVNFSYDLKYRFHSDAARERTEKTINEFHKRYNYICGVQMILTQNVIDMYLKGWRTYKLIEEKFPGNMISFLYPHPINRGKDYAGEQELEGFCFTRESFFKFINILRKEEPRVFQSFLYSTRNSGVFKYTMLYEKIKVDTTQMPLLSDGKELLSDDCHHSILYKCYSNSDKCMLCDLEEFV